MRKFELCIRAENFKLKKDGKVKVTGFYAARGVEAKTMSEATDIAMEEFRKELKPLSMNEQGNPPKFRVVEINEVYYFQAHVDIGERAFPTSGYVWDEDKEEIDDIKVPLSSWRGGWGNLWRSLVKQDAHVHSMAVHFTSGLYPIAILLMFLFIVTGDKSFDQSYLYIMISATVSAPITYGTGLLEWKRRNQGAMIPIFVTKIRYGVFLVILGLACTLWRFFSPQVLHDLGIFSIIFVALNLAILPFLVYLGHMGGIIVYEGKN